jgi:hypothetical protein
MKWARKFGKPIALRDGRTIATLADAREIVEALPSDHLDSAHWRYASEMLVRAADHNEKYSTQDARAQLTRALLVEGLVEAR